MEISLNYCKGVPTVRKESENFCKKFVGTLIRINMRDHDVPSDDHISLPLSGLRALKKIDELLLTLKQ